MIRAWTVQDPGVLRMLERRGRVRISLKWADEHFCHAYGWMRTAMRIRRLRPPVPGLTPIWVWLQHPGHPLHDGRKGSLVRLTLDLPLERLLVSDFDMWHAVLNRSYCALNEAEDDAWFAKNEARQRRVWRGSRVCPDIRDSWNRIFPLEPEWGGRDPNYHGDAQLQGTVWELLAEDVVRVEHFNLKVKTP